MPRYKVRCDFKGCAREWWIVRRVKLDEIQHTQLRRSICQECAAMYRRAVVDLANGTLTPAKEEDQRQLDKIRSKLRDPNATGYIRQIGFWPRKVPFVEQALHDQQERRAELAKIEEKLAQGIVQENWSGSYPRQRLKKRWLIQAWNILLAEVGA